MCWVYALISSAFRFEECRTPPVFRVSRRKARKSLSHYPLRCCPRCAIFGAVASLERGSRLCEVWSVENPEVDTSSRQNGLTSVSTPAGFSCAVHNAIRISSSTFLITSPVGNSPAHSDWSIPTRYLATLPKQAVVGLWHTQTKS